MPRKKLKGNDNSETGSMLHELLSNMILLPQPGISVGFLNIKLDYPTQHAAECGFCINPVIPV